MKPRTVPLGDSNMIGATLVKLRKAAHMKQKDLLREVQLRDVDISPIDLSRIEGQHRKVSDKELCAFAEIFGMDVDTLLHYPKPD